MNFHYLGCYLSIFPLKSLLSNLIIQVYRAYSVIGCHNLEPNSETFRRMIFLCVRMKDVRFSVGFC